MVGSADLLLSAASAGRRWSAPRSPGPPRRILLLRLERIGDLLMTLDALADLRARAPEAEIHLVVGSWNERLARLIPTVDRIETLDARWLSRGGAGTPTRALLQQVTAWRTVEYDLALNFEPDIRTNLLLAMSGAIRRWGFGSAGGGAFLTDPLDYDTTAHTADNAVRLVTHALPGPRIGMTGPRGLRVPDEARRTVRARLGTHGPTLVGINPSGGRRVKQWPPERFAAVATRLAREREATVVVVGAPEDRALADAVMAAIPDDVPLVDTTGTLDLVHLAALCQELSLLVTGDTGPMHLAAAVGTPIVAVFGPSDPARYAPGAAHSTVVQPDLWCSPCNRIRLPPSRCRDGVPDCLASIDADAVHEAAVALLVDAPGGTHG